MPLQLSASQLQQHLCALDEMAEDVPTDKLTAMTDLDATLAAHADCKFKCRNHEQVRCMLCYKYQVLFQLKSR